jgi:hypothetical protein
MGQSVSRVCCVKRCRRVARQAFDIYDPWHAQYVGPGVPAPGTPMRHYEACDRHAAELFGDGGYVERGKCDAIAKRAVAR